MPRGVKAKPVFKHECPNCTFLGTIAGDQGPYDLYHCPQGLVPTVIARYSSDGPGYTSGWPSKRFAREFPLSPLVEAAKRAIRRGLAHPTHPANYGA